MDTQVSSTSQVVCVNCNAVLPQGSRFCDQCGTQVQEPITCPACKASIPHDSRFCDQCGATVS
ncbi:DNA-directed RNA polymerase subunit E' [Anaerolineae bacterium]|nr:DNA-directed RNA polymerase subunit E' [Anaerolineae bacterium]